MDVTIFHNPNCSTSRNTLALIRGAGIEPVVVDYQRAPPTRERLQQLLRDAGLQAHQALRWKEPLVAELGLDPGQPEARLLDALLAHPRLLERPIVETPRGVRLCRPAERVLEVLTPR
jgi:arsenate reductase (glutaredoxin)